ncbi:hypothetical protein Goari_020277 [Gossypium aridum]|uniref:Uncharacterized protein n=1 Tax=Gossypium aridum TaxID=34290 RepID=A0A7J8WVL4_GOSAI|nr:hypothetical protein [Gossypium aridum]
MLEENALRSKNVDGEGESWVVASWLRDHLLLPRERKDPQLWKKVEELVQDDSRVDRYPKLVKGESKVVWEWQVEGSLSSTGRRKKGEGIELKSNEGINTNINQSSRTLKTGALLAHIVHYASYSLFNLVSYLSNVVKVPWRPLY